MRIGNYKIKWQHGLPPHRGTHCGIYNKDNVQIANGVAWCHAKDHFCKDTGRKLSLARALKDAQLSKDERKVIWEIYRNEKPNKRW